MAYITNTATSLAFYQPVQQPEQCKLFHQGTSLSFSPNSHDRPQPERTIIIFILNLSNKCQKKHYCRVVSSLPFRHASPFAPSKLILITLFTNIWFPENILTYCSSSLIVLLCYCSNYVETIFSWKWKFWRLFLAFFVRVCLKALQE